MAEGLLRVHRGGLYRGALLPHLLAPVAGSPPMTPAARALAQRIVSADVLFKEGRFEASFESAHALLDEVVVEVAGDRTSQWRAELLGLVGRCALHLDRLDEALTATRDAIRAIHDLHDDSLWPFLEGLRENLLTILAAQEPRPADGEADGPP